MDMHPTQKMTATALCIMASASMGCGGANSGANKAQAEQDEKVLNFYNWADYISPDTLVSFEKLTGIKVRLTFFETN